jgi:hypothetical protein
MYIMHESSTPPKVPLDGLDAGDALSVLAAMLSGFVKGSVRGDDTTKGMVACTLSRRARACPAAPLGSADAEIHASCTCNCGGCSAAVQDTSSPMLGSCSH